jgi:ribosomal-protein-alanine N-acetyltransferase
MYMDMGNYHIRKATAADLDVVLVIEKSCYPYPWSSKQFFQELENPAASIDLYEIECRIVGYICYWLIAGEMQILNLAISTKMRRKGIAGQLLDHAFESCSLLGLSSA